MSGLTPFQTAGPFFDVLLRSRVPNCQVSDATLGTRIAIEGNLYDGEGSPIRDGLIETWQADAQGRYPHQKDRQNARPDPYFFCHGWTPTNDEGRFRIETIKPGAVAASDGRLQAPHILVSVMGRGILTRHLTRLYFEDEPSNETDPILALVPHARRQTLIARRIETAMYRFDIKLQGAEETVFFDV